MFCSLLLIESHHRKANDNNDPSECVNQFEVVSSYRASSSLDSRPNDHIISIVKVASIFAMMIAEWTHDQYGIRQ